MKKTLCLLTAALVLASCSSDESDSSQPGSSIENPDPSIENPDPSQSASILPKKRMAYENSICYSDQVIKYNGNKIVSVTDENEIIKYTYTGNLITKIVKDRKYNSSTLTTDYTYTNGKLVSSIDRSSVSYYHYRSNYIYNNDGTVSCETIQIVVNTGVERSNGIVRKYTLKDGNVIKKEEFLGNRTSTIYEYDTKNNPYKNVLGYSLLFDDDMLVNNLVASTTTAQFGDATTRTFINTYTENDFLKKQVGTYVKGGSTFVGFMEYYY